MQIPVSHAAASKILFVHALSSLTSPSKNGIGFSLVSLAGMNEELPDSQRTFNQYTSKYCS